MQAVFDQADALLCMCVSATEARSEPGRDVVSCKASGAALAQEFKIFDALAGSLPASPGFEDDPVACRLGLIR